MHYLQIVEPSERTCAYNWDRLEAYQREQQTNKWTNNDKAHQLQQHYNT